MTLTRLTEITLGVPNIDEIVEYYAQFGLIPLENSPESGEHLFGTVDGGQQLRVVDSPIRRLLRLGVGAESEDDLGRIATALKRLEVPAAIKDDRLTAIDPATGLNVVVSIAPKITAEPTPHPPVNAPGDPARPNVRADALYRTEPVRPRKLGHVVITSTDLAASQQFFTDGIGFKITDEVVGSGVFLRCSTDHHNLLIQNGPVAFMHHSSWEVDDVDEIGRGAHHMLEGHPERHTWGLGRHKVGSNFFYYLRDPAGNFSEYYSDMDEILDDQLWEPGVFDVATARDVWGPPLPPSMIEPDDLAELMAGLH
jgi:catechol 2,3-dioxygenase-like lactoylglutathione lyase family enzyme